MRARRDLFRLLCALGLCVGGAFGYFTLPLDVRNEAMKSRAGADAEAQAQRDLEFGPDDALVALLEPGSAESGAAPDALASARWIDELRSMPGIEAALPLPSSDPSAVLVALRIARDGVELDPLVERVRAAAPAGARLSITGQIAGEHAVAHALADEQSRIVPAILGVFGLLLLIAYRSSSLAFAALAPGLGAILLLGGIQRLLGLRIDPVSTLLAPVLLTVGVASSVHLVERYLGELASGDAANAATNAVRGLARPLLLTSSTTVAGFLALTLGSIPAVVRFGWLAALGTVLATLWVVALVPAWLRCTAARGGHVRLARARRADGRRATGFMERLAPAAPLLVASVALGSVFLAWRAARITTDTRPLHALDARDPFRIATERVGARLGGDEIVELYLPEPHPPLAPLAAARLVAALAAEPLVALPAGAPRRSDAGSLLVAALLRPSGSAEREALFARAESLARSLGFARARATGPAVQVARDSQAIVRDQRRGLVATLVVLWSLMAIGLRSPWLALIGLVPNVVPCLALYGGLELAGRPLSVASAMIATVLLGLIVDNTIHVLHGYASARAAGCGRREALARSIEHSGRAIGTSTVVLALGFAAGLAGRLETTVEFSLLAAGTIVAALACDLVLLPAILLLRARRAAPEALIQGGAAACAKSTT